MAAPTIADYLKYAKLQMAAEAFLYDNDGRPKPDMKQALKDGNKHASRFTDSEAAKFLQEWEVVDQRPNTDTGFSGTLYRCKVTDSSRGLVANEYVLSFRSTEFIDDAVRDSESTNNEIKELGFAFGQLTDMEDWYESIKSKIPSGTKPKVIGYSLGGHLATAFNLMHQGEIDQVITFNGAGIGKFGDSGLDETRAKLIQMVASFRELRGQASLEDRFTTDTGKEAYRELRGEIQKINEEKNAQADPNAYLLSKYEGLLTEYERKALELMPVPDGESERPSEAYYDIERLCEALKAVERITGEVVRVSTLHAEEGGASPEPVPPEQIAGCDLDYQLAARLTAKEYGAEALPMTPFSIDPEDILDNGFFNTLSGKSWGKGVDKDKGLENQYDLVGMGDSPKGRWAMVAHSQYHYGKDAEVFIEDQPFYRGNALRAAAKATYDNGSVVMRRFAPTGRILDSGFRWNDVEGRGPFPHESLRGNGGMDRQLSLR